MDGLDQQFVDPRQIPKTNLLLGRVNIEIDHGGRDGEENKGVGEAASGQDISETVFHRLGEGVFGDSSLVHIDLNITAIPTVEGGPRSG